MSLYMRGYSELIECGECFLHADMHDSPCDFVNSCDDSE